MSGDFLSSIDHRISVFINCVPDKLLSQVVHEPTRHAPLLYLVLTSGESIVDEVRVDKNLGTSDQTVIRFNYNVSYGPKLQINKERILNFRNNDYSKFRDMLKNIDWDREFKDQNWECGNVSTKFYLILNRYVLKINPLGLMKRKSSWWNREKGEKIRKT